MRKMKMVTALLVGSLILGACGNTVITSKDDSTSQGELSANIDNTTQNSTDSNLEEGSINETPEFVRSDNPIEAVPGDEPLVICTEEMYKQNVRALVDTWEVLNPGVKASIVAIPRDEEKAELKIASLKTELMAGEGPDVFILKAKQPLEEGNLTGLFPDPQKAISTGVFLKLDDYIARAKYMDPSTFPSLILNAGKNEDGQYILPYAYDYTLAAYNTSDLAHPDQLPMSWNDVVSETDSDIYQSLPIYIYYPQIFTQIADYENDLLLFDEDEFVHNALGCIEASQNSFDENNDKQAIYCGLASGLELSIQRESAWKGNNAHTFWALPNTGGGVTACINVYTAINSHTKQSENAFSFLDLVYSPQVLSGEGFCVDEKYYANGDSAKMDWNNGILLTHGALGQNMAQLSDEDKAQLQSIYNRINCVRFNTDMDQSLFDMIMQMPFDTEDNDKLQSIAEETYNTLWMKMAE